jgi:hypothetical protein
MHYFHFNFVSICTKCFLNTFPPICSLRRGGCRCTFLFWKAIEDTHTYWKSLFVALMSFEKELVMHISHFKSSRWGTSLFWEGIGGVRYSTFSCWNRTCACRKEPIWSPLHLKRIMCITYRFSKELKKLKNFKNEIVQALWISKSFW